MERPGDSYCKNHEADQHDIVDCGWSHNLCTYLYCGRCPGPRKEYHYCVASVSGSHPHRHTAYLLHYGDVFGSNRNYFAYGSGIRPGGSVTWLGPDMVRYTLCA